MPRGGKLLSADESKQLKFLNPVQREQMIAKIVEQLRDAEARRQRFVENNRDELVERAVATMRDMDRGLARSRLCVLRQGNSAWQALI